MFTLPMRPKDMPRHLPNVADYIIQPKYDGWYVVFMDGRAYTRTGEDITQWACWKGHTLPDNAAGELMHRDGRPRIAALANSADGMRCALFDAPGPEPIEDRLAKVPAIAERAGFEAAPTYSVRDWSEANRLLAAMQVEGNEGLVIKRAGSPWLEGDSRHWFRFKVKVDE